MNDLSLVSVHSTSANGSEHSNNKNKYFKLNITRLRISTGRRQTSWLFISVGKEFEKVFCEITPAGGQSGT